MSAETNETLPSNSGVVRWLNDENHNEAI